MPLLPSLRSPALEAVTSDGKLEFTTIIPRVYKRRHKPDASKAGRIGKVSAALYCQGWLCSPPLLRIKPVAGYDGVMCCVSDVSLNALLLSLAPCLVRCEMRRNYYCVYCVVCVVVASTFFFYYGNPTKYERTLRHHTKQRYLTHTPYMTKRTLKTKENLHSYYCTIHRKYTRYEYSMPK